MATTAAAHVRLMLPLRARGDGAAAMLASLRQQYQPHLPWGVTCLSRSGKR